MGELRTADVPAVRAVHLRMREVAQRAVHARDRPPELGEVAATGRPRPPFQPAQQPHDAAVLAPRRPGEPRHRRLVAQVLEHGVLERQVLARLVQLQDIALVARVEPEVEVELAGQGGRDRVQPIVLARHARRIDHAAERTLGG